MKVTTTYGHNLSSRNIAVELTLLCDRPVKVELIGCPFLRGETKKKKRHERDTDNKTSF